MDAMNLQVPWVLIMVHYRIPRFLINNCRFRFCEVEGKQAKILNFE
jgi:hypothetical protein